MDITIACELTKAVRVQTPCEILYSTDTNNIIVNVFKNAAPENISGTVTAYMILPDGSTITETGTISWNTATVELPSEAYDIPGIVSVAVKLSSSGMITTIAAVALCVQ